MESHVPGCIVPACCSQAQGSRRRRSLDSTAGHYQGAVRSVQLSLSRAPGAGNPGRYATGIYVQEALWASVDSAHYPRGTSRRYNNSTHQLFYARCPAGFCASIRGIVLRLGLARRSPGDCLRGRSSRRHHKLRRSAAQHTGKAVLGRETCVGRRHLHQSGSNSREARADQHHG